MQATARADTRAARPGRNRRWGPPRRWGRAALVGAALGVAGAAATAPDARAAEATGPAAADFGAATERRAADVALIGDAAKDTELAKLFCELLARQGIDATLRNADRFDPEKLFAEQASGTLLVFLALNGPREARLYFRAPQGERYLVRKLTLPSGLDAVGRELVGQVVASAAEALFDTAEGLNRDQATSAIADDAALPEEPPALPPAAQAASPPPPTLADLPAKAAPHSTLQFQAAARYAAAWTGADFGVRHGPAVTGGLRSMGAVTMWGGELGAEYGFEQHFVNAEVEARRRSQQLYGVLTAGVRVGGNGSLVVGAGPRVELTQFRLVPKAAGVMVESPQTEVRVGARTELCYEWAPNRLSLGACALADIAFARTHYDLREAAGAATELASVGVLRPGGAVWIGARWE